jgi:hypothetical protein
MAILNKGQTFSDGEQVTSTKLNTAVDGATFAAGAVDDVSTQLSGGGIIVKDGGVTTTKIADSSITTLKIADSNITTTKIADSNVTTAKIADSSITTSKITDSSITLQKLATAVKDALYPVGSIYTNATDATNPATLIGFGTWVAFGAGKVPVGIDTSDTDFDVVGIGTNTNGTTGTKTHTLSINEIPEHNHSVTSTGGGIYSNFGSQGLGAFVGGTSPTFNTNSVGGGQAHNNLQPYIVVYMWKRTA